MKTVPLKTKKLVLKMFRSGQKSQTISNTLKLDRSVVKEWQYLYEGGDTRWVTDKPINRAYRFSEAQRVHIVKAYVTKSLSMADLCRTFLVPKTMVKQWVRTFKKDGSYHGDPRTEENKRLRERECCIQEILRAVCTRRTESSKKKILRDIERGKRAGLSVSYMLKQLGIPRSVYYYWLKHPKEDDHALVENIKQIQVNSNYNIGAKKMAQILRQQENPIIVNHKKVEKIMSENSLHAKQKIRKHPKEYYRQKEEAAKELPSNILNRDFASDQPRKKLLTDITYIRIKYNNWCFLSAVKDLFNKEIIAYVLSTRLDRKLVLDTLKQLKQNIGSLNGVLLHSDQGWTYSNPQFVQYLKKEEAIQSMSRKANCWDNAPMESFFSTFKSETIHHDKTYYNNLSFAEMKEVVENYIFDYNHNRISQSLGWLSPIQYFESYVYSN